MRWGCIPPIIPPNNLSIIPPIIYRTLQNYQNCFSYPAKIVKLSQRKIMTEKSESISMKTFFFFFRFGDHLIFGRKNVRISDFGRRMWLNFDEDLFFLETTCFWAEITNVFQRFPRNYMCNFWWLCFIPPNNFYGFTPLSLSSKTSFKHVQNRSKRFIACQISRKMKKKNKLLLAFEKEFLLLKKMIEIQFWQILT